MFLMALTQIDVMTSETKSIRMLLVDVGHHQLIL